MRNKVEVQEALSPAGVLGAEPLSLMPQHLPREPAKRCFRAMAANQGFFDTLCLAQQGFPYAFCRPASRQSALFVRKGLRRPSFFDGPTRSDWQRRRVLAQLKYAL